MFCDPPKPLAIGIHNDIIPQMNHSPEIVSGALHVWTARSIYKKALIAGGPRYNLDGTLNGEVSESDQIAATNVLASRAPNFRIPQSVDSSS